MQVFDGFEELVHHVTFVDVFKQCAFLYHCVQVGICAKGTFLNQVYKTMEHGCCFYDFNSEKKNPLQIICSKVFDKSVHE